MILHPHNSIYKGNPRLEIPSMESTQIHFILTRGLGYQFDTHLNQQTYERHILESLKSQEHKQPTPYQRFVSNCVEELTEDVKEYIRQNTQLPVTIKLHTASQAIFCSNGKVRPTPVTKKSIQIEGQNIPAYLRPATIHFFKNVIPNTHANSNPHQYKGYQSDELFQLILAKKYVDAESINEVRFQLFDEFLYDTGDFQEGLERLVQDTLTKKSIPYLVSKSTIIN
jgi:hypothetical protein